MSQKTPSPQSKLVGPSWIFPEMVSFFVRCSELMAIACIAEVSQIGTMEIALLLMCGLIFLLNCFEFSRPPTQVIFLYTISALLSATSVIVLVSEASINQKYSPEKYYTTIFESLAASGNAIVMGYFYLYHHDKKFGITRLFD